MATDQDDDGDQTPKRQVRSRMDFEELEDYQVPAVSLNTLTDQDLQLEEHEFATSTAAATRDIRNEFEEIFQTETTIEEQIKDVFLSCIDQSWVTQRHGR